MVFICGNFSCRQICQFEQRATYMQIYTVFFYLFLSKLSQQFLKKTNQGRLCFSPMKQQSNPELSLPENLASFKTTEQDSSNMIISIETSKPINIFSSLADESKVCFTRDEKLDLIQTDSPTLFKANNQVLNYFGDHTLKNSENNEKVQDNGKLIKFRERDTSLDKSSEPSLQKRKVRNKKIDNNQRNCLLAVAQNDERNQDQDYIQSTKNQTTKQKIQESLCYIYGNSQNIEEATMKITRSKVCIGPINIGIEKVMKIKIFPSHICQQYLKKSKEYFQLPDLNKEVKFYKQDFKIQKQNVIKISIVNNVLHFSQRYPVVLLAEPKQSYSPSVLPKPESPSSNIPSRLPLPFLSYATIVLKKLRQIYPLIKSTDWDAPKFNLRAIIKSENSIHLVNQGSNKLNKKNYGFMHGKIYKKSKHKLKWQKRYIIVNHEGIYSYRHENDELCTFEISAKQVKYMWTWFTVLRVDKNKDKNNYVHDIDERQEKGRKQKVGEWRISGKGDEQRKDQAPEVNELRQINQNQNPYLIVKLKHGFNTQTQFGIPICGFDNEKNMHKNWLFAFYKLLSHYEY